jgi:outer membrane protein assembly factor BamB
MNLARLPLRVAALLLAAGVASAGDPPSPWPSWRGPGGCGSTGPGDYPVKWSVTENLRWKAPLPSKGCSTPILWGPRIIVTAPADGQDAVLAFDPAGKPLWQAALGPEQKGKHRNGSGSNPSAVTDGRILFAYFKSGTLAGLDGDGKILWQTNLQERFGRDTLYWDVGTSPVLTEQDVVVSMIHRGESWLAAFDKGTGALRWRTTFDFKTPDEGDHSYATPAVIRHAGKEAILLLAGERLAAHDASDGKLLWYCGDFNPGKKGNWVPVASFVVAGSTAVVPYARGSALHGIRLGGSGDVTATHRAWKREDTGSFVPTPAEYKGRVYLLRDRGEIECIDPATGKTLWGGALPKAAPNYYASPLVAGGRIYAAREDGVVFVARAEEPFEVLSENAMGERIIASPVPLSNRLLLRGEKTLFCVGAD